MRDFVYPSPKWTFLFLLTNGEDLNLTKQNKLYTWIEKYYEIEYDM
jgi:hypothetical protein